MLSSIARKGETVDGRFEASTEWALEALKGPPAHPPEIEVLHCRRGTLQREARACISHSARAASGRTRWRDARAPHAVHLRFDVIPGPIMGSIASVLSMGFVDFLTGLPEDGMTDGRARRQG